MRENSISSSFVAVRLFVLMAALFLLLGSGEPPWADAHVTYETTASLVDRGQLDVDLGGPPQFYAYRDGKKYGVFPLGNVVAMVPSYWAYHIVSFLRPAWPDRAVYTMTSHLSPSLMMAGVCALFFALIRRRGETTRTALWSAIALGTTTLCFIYARATYSEALQTLALLWFVERTLAQAERPTQLGMAWLAVSAGLLVNTKLVNVLLLVPAPIFMGLCARREGRLRAFFATLPLAAFSFAPFVAVALVHNYVKTGSLWDSGYRIASGIFSCDLFAGLYGFFFSTGKSVFLYSPPLLLVVLALGRAYAARRGETLFIGSLIVISTLFNAKFRHWHADYCWGPRHLVALTPLAGLMLFPWLTEALSTGAIRFKQALLTAVLVAGLGMQLLGASIYWDHYIRVLIAMKNSSGAPGWFTEHLTHGHYLPPFSPIVGQWWLLSHIVRGDGDFQRDAPWRKMVPQPASYVVEARRARIDWWMTAWDSDKPAQRAPQVAYGFGVAFFTLVVASAWLIKRKLSRQPTAE